MRYATLFLSLVLASYGAVAQCPDCTPDTGCNTSPAYPTMCPLTPPDATAGEQYQTAITFWMPATFTDPGTGVTVDFQQMTITGVSGLPFGLSIQYNQPGGVYYPQNESHGCAQICGTPVVAGSYPVTISILAGVSYNGFNLNVPEDFTIQLTVLPGSGGNAGFTFTPISGCGSAAVQFEALIDGSPAPTSYVWDFGDGTGSTANIPPVHQYSEAGDYTVTLETTIGGYVLQQVALTGVNDNWCGDVEEPNLPLIGCQGAPDLYFVLTDGSGSTYTSSTVDNSHTATWSGLDVPLNIPPYSISFYDEDAISQNDLLGTYNLPANGAGTYNVNVAGGTTGSLVVGESAQDVFTHTDTVHVYPLPEVVLQEDGQSGELCIEGPALQGYVWFLDGDTVPDAHGACLFPTGPGLWQVEAMNGFGCTAMSNTVVVCPEVEIALNGPVLQVPSGFSSYTWTLQGNAVGGNDPFLVIQGNGLYTVTVTDVNGCTVTAAYDLTTMGIADMGGSSGGMTVFPVPNNGRFTVAGHGLVSPEVALQVLDVLGRPVESFVIPVVNGTMRRSLDLELPPGPYWLRAWDGGRPITARFAVR
ncbi:MAG TPA: PKD domain-containing protein [Flavobacteriales bacterium]|nr:PKD domain-containing protein [Flavobacteriales bacterium]